MMTVHELITAIENSRGGYDDPVVIVRPVVGRGEDRFEVVDLEYSAAPADERDTGGGHLRLVISKSN